MSNVFVIIGCVVGAGFASGRELLVFFGDANLYFVAVCFFALFFSITFLFFCLGKKFDADSLTQLNKQLFGKWSKLFDMVFLLNGFLATSAMIAGMQTLWQKVTGNMLPLHLVIVVLCGVAVYFGVEGVKRLNFILVPIIATLLFVVALSSSGGVIKQGVKFFDFVDVAKYVSYNGMLMCGVLLASGKDMDRGQAKFSAAISATILSFLIFVILHSFEDKNFVGVQMPLLFLAKSSGLYLPFVIAFAFGIVTSLVSAAYPVARWGESICKDRLVSVVCLFTCAYVVSLVGFDKILGFVLPIVSVFSLVFVVCAVVRFAKR